MSEFNLDKFLKSYKPKKIDDYLKPYLKLKKLEKYEIIKPNKLKLLIPFKTYIKYIPYKNAFSDKNYDSHIKLGGILISGGLYKNNQYIKDADPSNWKYILVKYETTQLRERLNNIESSEGDNIPHQYYFILKLSNNYIFYRYFNKEIKNINNRKILTKLIKKSNNEI